MISIRRRRHQTSNLKTSQTNATGMGLFLLLLLFSPFNNYSIKMKYVSSTVNQQQQQQQQ